MTDEKLDRRKKYTRMVLKNSMIKLLKDKQISEITVKEICKLADINRSTFYSHYLDLYDLLNKMEEEVIDDMEAYLYQHNFQKDEESIQMTERILAYIVENKEIAQILLHENADPNFQKRVMKIAQKYLMDSWGLADKLDEDFSHYLSIFTIGGCLQMIREWLQGNLSQTPKEMAILINEFANNGLSVVK